MSDDTLRDLQERVRAADAARTPLRLRGGGTKDFYGEAPRGEPLELSALRGIVDYEPTELVVTARCGTPLAELEAALAGQRQMLGFEPPHFGANATVGGCVAAGLSGPRRAAAGSVRDFVLGAKLLDARGRVLSFGGQVMKNVAGYDVSRLLAGSLGVLGAIVEVSLKVLPLPAAETTLRLALTHDEALVRFNQWGGQPLPISATAWHDGAAWVRLSGAPPAIDAAVRRLGGETVEQAEAADWWRALREQTLPFFGHTERHTLWRLSVPSTTPRLDLPGRTLIEWGGALRWLRADDAAGGAGAGGATAEAIRTACARVGGSATLFRGPDRSVGAFHPLAPAVLAIHHRLKRELDPNGIFNPGRMYAEI